MANFEDDRDERIFDIQDDQAYATTLVETWQAVRFLHELKLVDPNEIALEDRACTICMQLYNDQDILHVPVRLPCSHVFGKLCLAKWITPLGAWEDNEDGEWEQEKDWFSNPYVPFSGSVDCPLCRRELCPRPPYAESAMGLEARLMLWDRAYEKVYCVRSDKEEKSRANLIQYIEFYRIANGGTIEREKTAIDQRWSKLGEYHAPAAIRLFGFVQQQKIDNIDNTTYIPTLDRILLNLENLSINGFDIMLNDPSYQEFVYVNGDHESQESGTENNDGEDDNNNIENDEVVHLENAAPLEDDSMTDDDDVHMENAEEDEYSPED